MPSLWFDVGQILEVGADKTQSNCLKVPGGRDTEPLTGIDFV